jgi:hypothetical protein
VGVAVDVSTPVLVYTAAAKLLPAAKSENGIAEEYAGTPAVIFAYPFPVDDERIPEPSYTANLLAPPPAIL